MTTHTRTLSLDDGKYTLYRTETDGEPGVDIRMERYRERWPAAELQFIGNKFLHSLVDAHFELEDIARAARNVVEAFDAVKLGETYEIEDHIEALRIALNMPVPTTPPASSGLTINQLRAIQGH
jgi:hypothetical protein